MSDKIVKKVENLPQLTAVKRTDKLIQRVAAYARVSTGKEEQQTSIVAQKEYYTDYIKSHAGWQFVGVYADEGISGCSTKRREQFKQLMSDCMAGKIDMVLTKSISRFGRNTVDTLTAIRELKSKGIGVYFEKEQVWTMDSKGEFIITLMSSLAQEESRSMSENILWAVRKRYAQGKGSFAYSRVLGLDKGKEKFEIVVNREEAVIVCKIFRMFIQGLTPHTIAIALTAAGIPSPGGCEVWSAATVRRMLSNEKYKGDMLLQKKFTVDFLEKKMKPNEGEVPQYYVTGSHPAIIEPDEWEQVQAEFARRKTLGKAYIGKSVLSAKLVCEDCGAFFGPKVWHSTDQYRRTIWQCNGKFANEERCHTPVVDTETIQRLFIKAYNLMMQNRVQIIKQCEAWRMRLMDFGTLDADIERQLEETQVVAELVKAAVKENASTAQSQEAYLKKYEALTERYEKAAAELERLQSLRTARSQQDKKMALYIRTLKKQPEVMHDWNDTIWTVMIERAIVHRNGEVTFAFANGTEIKVGA